MNDIQAQLDSIDQQLSASAQQEKAQVTSNNKTRSDISSEYQSSRPGTSEADYNNEDDGNHLDPTQTQHYTTQSEDQDEDDGTVLDPSLPLYM